MGLAFMLACPACAGGFFLAIGAAFGATALALKGFALAALDDAVTIRASHGDPIPSEGISHASSLRRRQ